MLTRILAVVAVLLAAIVVNQYSRMGELNSRIAELNAEIVAAQTRALAEARSAVADSMEGQGAEVQRLLLWLNDFYQSADGLQRPQGLWIAGRPDYEGIGHWAFDVYLRRRLKGGTEEARRAVETTIKQSDEWRSKHRTPS